MKRTEDLNAREWNHQWRNLAVIRTKRKRTIEIKEIKLMGWKKAETSYNETMMVLSGSNETKGVRARFMIYHVASFILVPHHL